MAKGKKEKKGKAKDEQKPAGSKKLIIILIALIVLLLAGGGAAAWFFILSPAESKTTTAEEAPKEPEKGDAVYVSFGKDFTVNLSGPQRRFLQVGVSVLVYFEEAEDALTDYMPQLRSNLILLFGNKTHEDVRSEQGRIELRAEVLAEIRKVLAENEQAVEIENVFFTKFVSQ